MTKNTIPSFLSLALMLGGIFFGAHVFAAPVLDVSISPQTVLLGGKATYTINVTNTGPDKGYNLSFESVFDSDRTDPEGRVTFSAASDSDTALAFTTNSLNATTGDRTVSFENIRDLAPSETYSFTLEMDLSGDVTWQAMDDLIHDITATVNDMPDGSGTDVTGTDSDTSDVLPIALVQKRVNQSTGVGQATGTIDRVFGYEIDVQNNYAASTDTVVITDTLPDGIEFLGITSGHTCSDSQSATTGITTITCNLGTMVAAQNEVIEFDAGIRYDYYGTDNGGTNRVHDDFDGTPATGTPIPDKTVLTNSVDLDAVFSGTPVATQTDQVNVAAAYATVAKSGHIGNGVNGSQINYTITYTTSEYYDILDDNIDDDSSSITLHDTLPDGTTYITSPAPSPAPTSVTVNGDGTTDIYWNSSVLSGLASSSSFAVTFSATVDLAWNDSDPIVAGDSLINMVTSHGEWDDQVDTGRANGMTDSSAAASFDMSIPQIEKHVEDPDNPGSWLSSVNATVGDQLRFRVRFNTTDGSNPTLSNIRLGDVVVTDWLPKGMSYVGASAVESYSNVTHFTDGGDPDTESAVTSGSLNGVEWTLGDVEMNGWWEATFFAVVDDVAAVEDGTTANNLWKMTGVNTAGDAYSDRDIVDVAYEVPYLVLSKSITSSPSPLKPGDAIEYTVTIQNTGATSAEDVVFVDTVSPQMVDAAPTVTAIDLNGTPLVESTDYLTPTFNSGTRAFEIDLNDAAIETSIPVGETLTIVYEATVDNDTGSGYQLHNTATTSYNSQDDGSGRATAGTSNVSDDNTDNATISLPEATVDKTVSSGPFGIGDTIPYTIEVTVPAGHIVYWPEIEDTFNRDGISYVPSSAALTLVSGTPVTAASFDAATNPDPNITTTGSDNTFLEWLLADPIDNRGQVTDYVFNLTYDVVYTGLEDNGTDWEFFVPTTGDQINNTARLRANNISAGSRTTNENDTDSAVTNIDQPLLTATKTVTSSGPYNAGSPITYQVVLENTGYATAYDITWEDAQSTFVGGTTLTSVTHSASGALASGTGFLENFTGNPLTIDFDGGSSDTNLAVGETLTIVYASTVQNDVGAGSSVNNTTDVDWSSENDTVVGERIYNDAAEESTYTADMDTASETVTGATFAKSITSPVSGQATIGETIDYRLRVTVPSETVLFGPSIQDVIATNGMQYVNGSVAVVDVSGNPQTPASIVVAPLINTTSPNPGATIDFTFNTDIDNSSAGSPTGDTAYVFDVTYQMLVTGLDDASAWMWDPATTGYSTTNIATLSWSDGSSTHTENDNAALNIIQPHLTLTKNFDTATVAGGDSVTATVVIENTGNGTAYELDAGADYIDTMPAGFTNPVMTSVTHSANGVLSDPADYSFNAVGNDFTLEYNSSQTDLAPTETLTIVYTVDIEASIGSGADIANSADVDYSSMSGSQTDERVFDDSDALEGTADEDTDNVTTALATMAKTTSLTGGEATIGEEFDYVITATIPQDTTIFNAAISDTIPDGLTVLGTLTSPVMGSVVVSPEVSGETPITWTIGDLAYTTATEAALTVTVRVDDAFDGGALLDGLGASADGDAQDVLTNDGQFGWDDANTGGTTRNLMDDVDVTVVEPNPDIQKTVNLVTAAIGDTRRYTVVLSNANGGSALRDIDFLDTIPTDIYDTGTSPALVSVTHSTDGVLTSGADFTEDFGDNPVEIDFAAGTTIDTDETITIVYDVIVENTVIDGQSLVNDASYTGRTEDAADNGDSNARIYTDNDTATITIADTSISNFVWHDTDRDGNQDGGEVGFEGVTVRLLDGSNNPVDDPQNPGTPYVVTTDSSGNYIFVNMASGSYRIQVDLPTGYDFAPQNAFADTVDSDVSTSTGISDLISITPGTHDADADAGIIGASIGNYVWHDIDGDGNQDGGEADLPGVTVRLLDSAGTAVDDPLNVGTPYVVATDSSGNYIFEHLPAGDYIVEFDMPTGYRPSVMDAVGDTVDSDIDPNTRRTDLITLSSGTADNTIDAGLFQPATLGDTIWRDTNADGIQDASEEGLQGVIVRLLDASDVAVDDPQNPGSPYVVTTDGSGNYLFENLLPGTYKISIDVPTDNVISAQDATVDEAQDSDLDPTTRISHVITLIDDEDEVDVDAGLYETVSIGDLVWRDDSRDGIKDNWESGLSGVTVALLDGTGTAVDEPGNPGTPYAVTTDADGAYLFENLVPGDYQVQFTELTDYKFSPQNAGSDDALDGDQDPTTGITHTITLTSGQTDMTLDAGMYGLYTNVFDPPSAIKTVNQLGQAEIEWKMVWINDGNKIANAVQVLDDVPAGTTYVDSSVQCDARGNSTTSVCTYDAAENRVRWEGSIDYDENGTDEDDSLHEVVITYRSIVPLTMDTVQNQAQAYWDANGDGDFEDDVTRGQTSVPSDDPETTPGEDPTVWERTGFITGTGKIGNDLWHDKNGNGKWDDDEDGLDDIDIILLWAGPDNDFDTDDDQTWKTETNSSGHYEFDDLPEGRYQVRVDKNELKGYIQTYDPGNTMNHQDQLWLDNGEKYTKADFGYNMTESELAKTGSNAPLYMLLIVGLSLIGFLKFRQR